MLDGKGGEEECSMEKEGRKLVSTIYILIEGHRMVPLD